MATVDELRRLFAHYCQPGLTCSDGDMDVLYRLTVAVQSVLRKREQAMLVAYRNKPLVYAYQSDGWSNPITTVTSVGAGGRPVQSRGRFRQDFVLERGITRGLHYSGRHDLTFSFSAPRALLNGVGSLELFGAACEFCHTLRSRGHEGASLTVYVFDRALFSAMMRLLQGRHELFYHPIYGSCPVEDKADLRNTDLVEGIPCTVHGGQLAVIWALKHVKDGVETSSNAKMSIKSLLNCCSALHQRVRLFIMKYVKFVDRDNSARDVSIVWSLLAVPPSRFDLFVAADPWWDSGSKRLLIDASMSRNPLFAQQLEMMVLTCRRFTLWSDTRWAASATSGRLYMRGLATGLSQHVEDTLADKSCSSYLLGGFLKAGRSEHLLLAVASIAVRPIEYFITSMVADDRLFFTWSDDP